MSLKFCEKKFTYGRLSNLAFCCSYYVVVYNSGLIGSLSSYYDYGNKNVP